MKFSELLNQICEETEIPKGKVKKVLTSAFDKIEEFIEKGEIDGSIITPTMRIKKKVITTSETAGDDKENSVKNRGIIVLKDEKK